MLRWIIFALISTLLLYTLQQKVNMPPKPKLNVHNFPRPPLLERTPRHLQIKWNDQVIADTTEAFWVLETTHPPSTSLRLLKIILQLFQLYPKNDSNIMKHITFPHHPSEFH